VSVMAINQRKALHRRHCLLRAPDRYMPAPAFETVGISGLSVTRSIHDSSFLSR
jgi:hypothetical protein